MKRHILVLLVVFGFSYVGAQNSLLIEPPVVKKQVVTDLTDYGFTEVIKVKVTNTTREPVHLRWDKEVRYQPTSWEQQICDKEASYPPQVNTNYNPLGNIEAPVHLAPGESFDLYLSVLPYMESGHCKIEIPFRSLENPEIILATAVFQISIFDKETFREQQSSGRPRLYPNPVHDYFSIAGAPDLGRVEIFNTLGRRIKSFEDPEFGDSYDVSDIPPGVYLISLTDKNGQVIRTLRMLRRNFRP